MWTMVLVKMLGFFFLISLEFTGEKIVCKNVPNFHFFPFPSFLALNPTEMYVCNFKKKLPSDTKNTMPNIVWSCSK